MQECNQGHGSLQLPETLVFLTDAVISASESAFHFLLFFTLWDTVRAGWELVLSIFTQKKASEWSFVLKDLSGQMSHFLGTAPYSAVLSCLPADWDLTLESSMPLPIYEKSLKLLFRDCGQLKPWWTSKQRKHGKTLQQTSILFL